MVDVFAYDGHEILTGPHSDFLDTDDRFRETLKGAIAALSSGRPVLLRQIVDRENDNFGGLEEWLEACLSNGHDRHDSSDWRSMHPGYVESLEHQGLCPKDVVWATELYRGTEPQPYFSWPHSEGKGENVAILVLDKELYQKVPIDTGYVKDSIYAQKGADARRSALLGIVLFDVHNPISGKRPPVAIRDAESDIQAIPEVLQSQGYFRGE